jgi:hypothetical protein
MTFEETIQQEFQHWANAHGLVGANGVAIEFGFNPSDKHAIAAILAAHRAELVAELTWARSQAPRLHDESETVDKWDCEHYRSLLTERIAALTDNTKEAERD